MLIGYFKYSDVFAQFVDQIDIFFSVDWLLQCAQGHSFISPKIVMQDSLKDAMSVFTDGSSNGRAASLADGKGYVVQTDLAATQIAELQVVV